jgi:hypothetical protein
MSKREENFRKEWKGRRKGKQGKQKISERQEKKSAGE